MDEMLTWEKMLEWEPLLADLHLKIRGFTQGKSNQERDLRWYKEFKGDMSKLVGRYRDSRQPPELGTSEAYDIAYRKLYFEALHEIQHLPPIDEDLVF